ncbi:hypothetical protein EC957_007466 [Mortierella hygrophila]|uniref:Uncharacterized protein n=1 Tax=Mortierella hygrophila TaxID=979708 RepID=A0A9P6FCX8_9FUNG|nr:hypothetical protein EC957_007466 [Mortierella hygrophila]
MGHELLPTEMNGIDFDTLNQQGNFSSFNRYSRSKLPNILFAKALASRLANEHVYVNATHPDLVATEIGRSTKDMMGTVGDKAGQLFNAVMGYSAEEGALTQLYLATSPEIENRDATGQYFIPIANEIQPSRYARDEELQQKLWTLSENLAREKINV